ncbi:bifunctional tetrahydrofolate synthase/dihydrofolate synthase [Balneatrix alpica]|uniref:bifunctional tetrahydrofolate synthase/dihydrofolate synthase n=1 Tax=Balneatrix alpica TaxID=75684 RepID=UPI0027395394|nr:bifunctional tetrahydrofolate synthase/dihydrofolate synthase [Balneatrix alpica]
MRTLDQWLSWMEQQHPQQIELGLERVGQVWQALGQPQLARRVVTVGGTNGKGSTLTYLSQLGMAAGWKVGCYTSPHFLRYNERVCVQGQMVTDQQLCDAFAQVEQARQQLAVPPALTYFEFGTLAAFLILAEAQLDLVVLEVGLGGRLDAVNLIDADVAIITSIDLDHTDWLGPDRDSIGREKAGIFRPGRYALCADPEPPLSVVEQAERLGSRLLQINQQFGLREQEDGSWLAYGVDVQGRSWQLTGLQEPRLPLRNMAPALQAAVLLQMPGLSQFAASVLAEASLTGRFQSLHWQGREWLLDVAHNPEAARHLATWLARHPVAGKHLALCGMLKDKDAEPVLQALAPQVQAWCWLDLPGPRGQTGQELAAKLAVETPRGYVNSIGQAVQWLLQHSSEQDRILVFGSFMTVSAFLAHYQEEAHV